MREWKKGMKREKDIYRPRCSSAAVWEGLGDGIEGEVIHDRGVNTILC